MKEAQAPASPATFFAFPTCTSAGDPLGLELAGESLSSQKNPSFCGILRVVRLRVLVGRCGTAAGLRGGCGAAVAGAAVGRLRGAGLRLRGGCGAAVGRLRLWGCGAAAHWTKTAEFARVKWGDTPADLGVHENTKNCGIRARRFRVKWGDTPADLGVHENHKITRKLIGS